MKATPILLAVAALALSPAAAHAISYSATAEGCIRAGYDEGVLQTTGTWRGSYLCRCKSSAIQRDLDWQIYDLYVIGEAPREIIYASRPSADEQ